MATKFYVVWQGRKPGIYQDWPSTLAQVDKFPGAKYKSFKTLAEAQAAFSGNGSASDKCYSAKKTPAKNAIKTYSADEVSSLQADIKIFTDGACEPNPGQAGSGMAIYRNNEIHSLWYGLYNPQGTNNTAELNGLHQALIKAQELLAQQLSVVIFCDSKYAIQCITQWAQNWQKNGWKKSGGEIKNLKLIQAIFQLYQTLKDDIQILHVNGHVGVEGNELADRMSMYAVAQQQTDFTDYPQPINIQSILAMQNG